MVTVVVRGTTVPHIADACTTLLLPAWCDCVVVPPTAQLSVTMSGIPMSKGTPVRTQYWRSTRALEQCEEDPQSARVTEDKCGAIAYQLCIELPGSPSSLMILMTL
jgi:hypothetical protein